ncbi:MAG: folate-binding protein YgfZ [Pseudomonadota bacterium]
MHPTWKNFLIEQDAVITDGKVSHFGDPTLERQAVKNDTIIADLSHEAVITINGEDAETFLHGQFTNDVKKLNGTNWQLNGYCSPKGRLLASFRLWKQHDRYLLQLPSALRESIQKRLTMFVLRAKVKLVEASDETIRFGMAGPQAATLIQTIAGSPAPEPGALWQGENITVLSLGQNRFEILAAPEKASAVWQTLSEGAVKVGADQWDWLAIRAGEPSITLATQEQFVPQMANFELIGGVSFQKGCYPGQEIVARTQYLGKLKRRMYLVNIAADSVVAGDPLFSDNLEGQTSGMIVNAVASPDGGFDALAVVQGEKIENQVIHFKSLDGPALQPLSLPYAVP